jgi:hypothetical protein
MKWVVAKVVDNQLLGCVVGPFKTATEAQAYGERAGLYSLGYEKWEVRQLQKPVDFN